MKTFSVKTKISIFALRKVRYEIYAMKNGNVMARTKQQPLDNPFVYQGYESPEYFCDRAKETENLISALNNGRNITLISPRKIGKTGLIKHAFYQIKKEKKDAICVYVDIFSTKNLQEFEPS